MSDPATLAAVPGLIRATRLSVEEHAPTVGFAGIWRAMLLTMLFAAEEMADCLVQAVPVTGRPAAAPQQILAPLTSHAEPLVPRRGGDPRLPPGRNHP